MLGDMEDIALMTFAYVDVNKKRTSINVPLEWDTKWVVILNHVALALEGAGFSDVRKRIQVANFDRYYNQEEPEFIPLTEAMENR